MHDRKLYRVVGWPKYETSETRRLVHLHWVPMSNDFARVDYRLLTTLDRGWEIYAAWLWMFAVASRPRREKRGYLVDHRDNPLDALDLSVITGAPQEIFDLAFEVLPGDRIRWIEEVTDWPKWVAGRPPEVPADSAGVAAGHADVAGTNRTEQNGIEQKYDLPAAPDPIRIDQEEETLLSKLRARNTPDVVWQNLLTLAVAEAIRLPNDRLESNRRALRAMAERIAQSSGWRELGPLAVAIAEEKANDPRVEKPIAAWTAQIKKELRNGNPPHLASGG